MNAKRITAVLLCFSILGSLTACGGEKEQKEETKMVYGQVWSAPSTVKIDQEDVEYEKKGAASLSYEAVRNEYESCQLLITADKDVSSFRLEVSDLKNGDEVLAKENIYVYVQKYIPYNDYTGSGNMPDALIPIENAVEYGENTIKEKNNGGFWITVFVPKEAAVGTYEGSFKLIVNGDAGEKTMDIPVSVEVFGYTLSDESTAETLFSWRYDRVAAGELDGSIEMMKTYYDFFQEYRISLQSLPIETLSGEEYLNAVLKYYDRLTSFSLLSSVGDISIELLSHPEKVIEQILAVASASNAERNLFEKAIIYAMDEPDLTNPAVVQSVTDKSIKITELLQKCVDEIKEDNTGLYDEFKKIENWETSILDIPSVIPVTMKAVDWLLENKDTEAAKKLLEVTNCWCPVWECFNETNAEPLIELMKEYNIELWWYGCSLPYAPGATYHIGDSNLLSARSISWLQKKYNIVGNLYWDAAAYTDESGYRANQYIDVYEYPYRQSANDLPAGDGFLAYPGAAYGVYGPLPSLRLMSIRDGMEEYELLRDVEEKYTSMEGANRAGLVAANLMETFYTDLAYNGCYMIKDGEKGLDFGTLRHELLQTVANVNKGLGFAMGSVDVEGAMATFRYYIQDGAKIEIDGQEQQPKSEAVYEYVQDVEKSTTVKITITNSDGEAYTFEQFVAVPNYELNSLSEQSVLSDIQASEGSSVELAADATHSTDGTAVHANVKGVVTGNNLVDATYVPYISIATSMFGELQPADLANIQIDLYNPGEAFNVKVCLYSGSSYAEFGNFEVQEGKTTLTLDLKKLNFAQIESADRLAFEFDNLQDGKAASYEFYMDNIIGAK